MEYLLVLDAASPSARLNMGFGKLQGAEEDKPPTSLPITRTDIDTTHNHLLRVTWLPRSAASSAGCKSEDP